MELREANGMTGVVFTPESYEDVRIWVQDRSTYAEIVATPARLYLPVGKAGMATVDTNDVIWCDPERGDNPFEIERFD